MLVEISWTDKNVMLRDDQDGWTLGFEIDKGSPWTAALLSVIHHYTEQDLTKNILSMMRLWASLGGEFIPTQMSYIRELGSLTPNQIKDLEKYVVLL